MKKILILLYDERLPSNKNSSKLVRSLKTIKEIKKITVIEKNIITVAFIEIYCAIKNDKST